MRKPPQAYAAAKGANANAYQLEDLNFSAVQVYAKHTFASSSSEIKMQGCNRNRQMPKNLTARQGLGMENASNA